MSTGIYLAIIGYLVAVALRIASLKRSTDRHPPHSWRCLGAGIIALFLHATSLLATDGMSTGINFSFIHALSLVMLITNSIIVTAAILRPADQISIITFPIAALILVIEGTIPEPVRAITHPAAGMSLHIVTSLFAFSLLALASIQALLVSVQDAYLRGRSPRGSLLGTLPSLESMENLMFQLLHAGALLLTLSLISGFVFLEDMFAQHLAHKTVLSLIAWCLITTLLIGRRRFGWRGITAVRWTLAGFVTLMLAYFGSKFVIEMILKRH